MFHHYKLSEKDHPYAGVGVSWDENGKALIWERWTRMAMCFLSYQFSTTRMFAWGVEVIIGDQKDGPLSFIGIQWYRTAREPINIILPFQYCIFGTQAARLSQLRERHL